MQRVTKDPEIRRQEIIDTAMRLFIEKGYEQTSMLDITKSIGVSAGLCYRYFKSKEEIYKAALNTYVSQGVDFFISLLGDKEQPIIDVINTMPPMNKVSAEDNFYHQFFNAPDNSNFHLQMEIALIDRLIPILAERLELAKSKGEISIDNAMSVSSFYLYGQLGIWQMQNISSDTKIEDIRKCVTKILGI